MSYQQKRFYLFNCDNTYGLETVEKLLLEAGYKYGFKISVDRLCFGLQRMACTKTWNAGMPECRSAGILKPGTQNY